MSSTHEMKPFRGIWADGAATLYEFRTRRSNPNCERVIIMLWADGRLEARHIKGDARTSNFDVLCDWQKFNSIEDAKAWAVDVLCI
jgi:hypothetical protein